VRLLLVLVAVAVIAWYLSYTASRLDRLHARVEGARAALEAQLLRRSSVALELATSALLDPATSLLLATSAHDARAAAEEDREPTESDLSRALRAALPDVDTVAELTADPGGADLVAELQAATHRVTLARRFLGDAVRATLSVRRQRVVRYLRLAGHADAPVAFEMDDEPPQPFTR